MVTRFIGLNEINLDEKLKWNLEPRMVSVTVQTDDPERHSEWNRTAGFVRDGKFKERFVITVQRFSED